MTQIRDRFQATLEAASRELYADYPGAMSTADLIPTTNVIDEGDLELFFTGVEMRLIRIFRGGKFNTYDRPKPGGRWSLLSKSRQGGWYNAEYLPQLAAYVDAIVNHGYPKERVLFELPPQSLQLDLAIFDDTGRVVVLGEAKREVAMLGKLVSAVENRFGSDAPTDDSKKRGDESRQLAWRLWTIRAPVCWLIAPGERLAYQCEYEPLRLHRSEGLPSASELGLDHRPPRPLSVPSLQ